MTPVRRALRRCLALLPLLAAALAGGCTSLDNLERRLVFRPVAEDWAGYRPEILGQEEHWIPVGTAGERLHAWWVPAAANGSAARAPTLLYLHGARVNLSGSVYRIRGIREAGYNVLAIDYRGFGKSSPLLPSEDSVYEDAEAAWAWFAAREPDPRQRILYGHSLGGPVAAELAARHNAASVLVLESTFTSLREVADRGLAALLPLEGMLRMRFDMREKLARVRVPVLVLHGDTDDLVPPAMARELYALATPPKRLLMVEGAGHRWVIARAGDPLRTAIAELSCLPKCTGVPMESSTSVTGSPRPERRSRQLSRQD
jgi:pimeloyl-ACP methyl ester carboxylesterase